MPSPGTRSTPSGARSSRPGSPITTRISCFAPGSAPGTPAVWSCSWSTRAPSCRPCRSACSPIRSDLGALPEGAPPRAAAARPRRARQPRARGLVCPRVFEELFEPRVLAIPGLVPLVPRCAVIVLDLARLSDAEAPGEPARPLPAARALGPPRRAHAASPARQLRELATGPGTCRLTRSGRDMLVTLIEYLFRVVDPETGTHCAPSSGSWAPAPRKPP